MQTNSIKKERSQRCGFTLTELWIVIVTIAILVAVALPALAGKDRVFSIRTQCANQLRQIGVAVTAYAHDNSGYVLSAQDNNQYNQFGINPNPNQPEGFNQHSIQAVLVTQTNFSGVLTESKLGKLVYLGPAMTNGVNRIWCCPSVSYYAGLPYYNPANGLNAAQWLIGYGYYGGITWWENSVASVPSFSPVNLGNSKPYWVLAADLLVKYAGRSNLLWAIGFATAGDVPHERPGTVHPDGGNQLDADGSVAWVKWENCLELTDEAGETNQIHDYVYQRNLVADLAAATAANPTNASSYNKMLQGITTGALSPTP